MTKICFVCGVLVSDDGQPPVIIGGEEMVSHGLHPDCGKVHYGEDFQEILGGEPT